MCDHVGSGGLRTPSSLAGFMSYLHENTVACMSRFVRLLQQDFNFTHIFSLDANDKRLLRKERDKGFLERSLEKTNANLLPRTKTPSVSVLTPAPSVICNSDFKRCVPLETMFFSVEEPKARLEGTPPGNLETGLYSCSTNLHSCSWRVICVPACCDLLKNCVQPQGENTGKRVAEHARRRHS